MALLHWHGFVLAGMALWLWQHCYLYAFCGHACARGGLTVWCAYRTAGASSAWYALCTVLLALCACRMFPIAGGALWSVPCSNSLLAAQQGLS